jgi:uncharacterized protein with HEPN domain
MSVHDPQATLRQIQNAARHAQTICSGKTLDALLNDWQASAALERFIEIIGEAEWLKAGGPYREAEVGQ